MEILRIEKRTIEDCKEVALKYKVMNVFQKNECGVYLYSKRRGWLHEITSHMKKNNRWEGRIEEIHQIALKYENRGEFCKKDEYHYEVARRWGWLDEVCSHMKPMGHLYKRMVYVYEFEDKTAYIGLTYNEKRRNTAHMNSDDSPVYKYMIKHKLLPIKKVLTDGYIDSELAQKVEDDKVQEYKENGWKVLNRAKPGGLGGMIRIWTMEKLIETASKYTLRSEFRRKERKAWGVMWKLNIVDEICKNLINDDIVKYNEEMVIDEVKKYTKLTDFRKNSKPAYTWIIKNKRLDLISNLQRHDRWMIKENVINEALKYKTRVEFGKRSSGAYVSAHKYGWIDEVCSHMTGKVRVDGVLVKWTKERVLEVASKYIYLKDFRENDRIALEVGTKKGWLDETLLIKAYKFWNDETAKEECLKYNNRSEFSQSAGGAYYYLKTKGLLDEYTKHMELGNVKGCKRPLHTCSVCGEKVGGIANLKRWHEGNSNPNRPFTNKKLNKSR
jgi:predicted GIY-YIG superfamily endonuclease